MLHCFGVNHALGPVQEFIGAVHNHRLELVGQVDGLLVIGRGGLNWLVVTRRQRPAPWNIASPGPFSSFRPAYPVGIKPLGQVKVVKVLLVFNVVTIPFSLKPRQEGSRRGNQRSA